MRWKYTGNCYKAISANNNSVETPCAISKESNAGKIIEKLIRRLIQISEYW